MKKIIAIMVTLAAIFATTLISSPAQAEGLPCNLGSTAWHGWQWPPNGAYWGAGNYCGQPHEGNFRAAAWDGRADGHCVEVWRNAANVGGTWYAVPGTRACGLDVARASPELFRTPAARLMLVLSTVAGYWRGSFIFFNSNWL